MHTPSHCSTGSAPSSVEWRPSRLQGLVQLLVLAAAPWLIAASAAPPGLQTRLLLLAWLLGGAQCWYGQRRAVRVLQLDIRGGPLLLDGHPIEAVTLQQQGPWLQLRWRGPRGRGCLLFWPDTLDRAQRRELRLAVSARAVPQQGRSMAP